MLPASSCELRFPACLPAACKCPVPAAELTRHAAPATCSCFLTYVSHDFCQPACITAASRIACTIAWCLHWLPLPLQHACRTPLLLNLHWQAACLAKGQSCATHCCHGFLQVGDCHTHGEPHLEAVPLPTISMSLLL